MSEDLTPTAPRLEVTRGGAPTPEELAALVVALTPVSGGPDADPATAVPAWTRAALREGTGGARVAVPGDLVGVAPRG